MIFLSETRGPSHCIEKLKRQWNLNGVGMSSVGLAGGLALLWDKSVQLELVSFSINHMDVKVEYGEYGKWVRVTGTCGVPEVEQRHKIWDLFRYLNSDRSMPWFIGGDFNEILNHSEKQGGRFRLPRQMNNFNQVLAECALSDLGFEGYPFTWSNNREALRTVRCRLDRVCANSEAIRAFPTAMVEHVQQDGSGHIPIALHFERLVQRNGGVRRRPFRFEAMWIRKQDCEDIIRKVWENDMGTNYSDPMLYKGEECRAKLRMRSNHINPRKKIAEVQTRIMELRRGTYANMGGERRSLAVKY